jgi:DNA-binding transcriptional regulator YiaG
MSSRKELLAKCEELKIKNYKSKNKNELIELINNLTISSSTTTSKDKPENKRLDLLDEVLKEHSIKSLAKVLNVAPGTISRWKELNDIPSSYEFDLLKILNIDIDYSKYTSKEKDQFFTPVETAKYCYDIFLNKIKNELKIEGENDFQTNINAILSSDTVKQNQFGYVACLPSVHVRDVAQTKVKRAARSVEEGYLADIGSNLKDLDGEIISSVKSKNFEGYNIDAIINNRMVSWLNKTNLNLGACVIVKAKVKDHSKHWKHQNDVTRLNYVKAAQ